MVGDDMFENYKAPAKKRVHTLVPACLIVSSASSGKNLVVSLLAFVLQIISSSSPFPCCDALLHLLSVNLHH